MYVYNIYALHITAQLFFLGPKMHILASDLFKKTIKTRILSLKRTVTNYDLGCCQI